MRPAIRRATLERAEAALLVLGAALLAVAAVVRAPASGALAGTVDDLFLATAALSLMVGWRARGARARVLPDEPAPVGPVGTAPAVTAASLLALCVLLRVLAPGSALLGLVVAPLTLFLAPGLSLAPLLPGRGRGERLLLAAVVSLALQLVALLWLDLLGLRTTPTLVFALCGALSLAGALACLAGPQVPWLDRRLAWPPAPEKPPWPALARDLCDRVPARLRRWSSTPWLCFLFLAVLTVLWVARDRPFFFWDPGFHMTAAVELLLDPWTVLRDTAPAQMTVYPPLGHALLAVLFRLTGYDLDATRALFNLGFLALLLAATYGLGRELFSARAGALAVLCLAAYPEVFVRARWPLLDLPLAACGAATVYALLRSRDFADRRWSLLVGLLLGVGQLIKHLHVAMVLLPLLLALANATRARRWKNVGLSLAVAAALALPWWLPRLALFLGPWVESQLFFARTFGQFGTLSVLGLAYYSIGLWYEISFPFALLWLLALPAFLRRPGRGPLLLWWVGMYVVLTLILSKQMRYSAPLLPAVALMTGAGLDRWRRASAVAVGVALFGAGQAWAMSFGIGWLPTGRVPIPVTLAEPFVPFAQHTHLEMGDWPDPGGWGLAEPLAAYRGRIAVLDPYPGARENSHRFAFLREGVELQHLADRARGRPVPLLRAATCADLARLTTFDYVFVPQGPPGSSLRPGREAERCLEGLEPVTAVALRRGPGRTSGDFMGVSEVRVYRPRRQPPERRFTRWIAPAGPEVAVTIEDLAPELTPARLERLHITVRNRSRQPQATHCSFVVAEAGHNPWKEMVFRAPVFLVSLAAGETTTVEFAGPGGLPHGNYHVAAYLHRVDPVTGRTVPSHYASLGVTLGAPAADAR